MVKAVMVTNPECQDGGPDWCCIDNDGTGLWCDSCLARASIKTDSEGAAFAGGEGLSTSSPSLGGSTATSPLGEGRVTDVP